MDIENTTRREQPTACATAHLTVDEIGPWISATYQAVMRTVAEQGSSLAGPPYGRYHQLDDRLLAVEAGFPVTTPITASGDVRPSALPGGPVATTIHIGSYDKMEPAYRALAEWIGEHGGEPAGDAWENYFSDPVSQPDPETWRTEIVQPYRDRTGL
ncbi:MULTISPECIES: GyrI-like domain-containing protein [Amycolatopsis]|uniref:AraC effector-binding domain-containing protein n=1 Tax=Amycolatopsis tucumanensis TaxID=401106 RepID=A0ABP7HH49_9PSEU|nr:GyrI-like domain-containing protein [Amycolatopsis tucumanensis]MCF6423527.1 GyrI-like domain-containing protein [Amycolatopsis tucumanensis]